MELCSEDDWGSWELWWNVSADASSHNLSRLRRTFLDVVSDMVASGKLIPKRRSKDGPLEPTRYDRDKLASEISLGKEPDPATFIWFGTK